MGLGGLKIESYKKGILFSSGFNFLSKLSQFLQSVVIAYYFGTQAKTDIFFYCFTTMSLIALFINSLDSSVLIPESMRLNAQENKEASIKFLNFFIGIYLFIGVVVTILLYIAPIDFFQALSNFDAEILQENKEIVLLSIPLFLLMIITNLFVNILNSYKFFTISMITGLVNGLFALTFLISFHTQMDISSILIGQLLAYLINILFLIYLMKKQINWSFSFEKIKIEKRVLKNVLYSQAGNISSVLVSYIPVYLISSMSSGIITSLTYSQKVADIPHQLITIQFSAIAGIKLNELYAEKKTEQFNKIFLSSVNLLLFVLLPISALTFLFSREVITIVFDRGAFNEESVSNSAQLLKCFCMLLPFLALNSFMSRAFTATQKIKEAFWYQIITNLLLILMIVVGVKNWGSIGYPLALIAIHLCNIFLAFFVLKYYLPFIQYSAVLTSFFKYSVLNVLGGVVIFFLFVHVSIENALLKVVIGSFLFIFFIFITSLIFRIKEAKKYLMEVSRVLLRKT